jgi:hypothetical protein
MHEQEGSDLGSCPLHYGLCIVDIDQLWFGLCSIVIRSRLGEQKTSNPAPQPPKPAIKRPTIWGEPTEVEILLFVLDIDAVNSAEQSFSASVYLEARWNSSFLAHKGTGPIVRGLSDIWSPRLAIVNQCLPSALMGQIEVIA